MADRRQVPEVDPVADIFFQREEPPLTAKEKHGPGRETDDTHALERAYERTLVDIFGAATGSLARGSITAVDLSYHEAAAAAELAGEFGRRVVFFRNGLHAARPVLLPYDGAVLPDRPGVIYINANTRKPYLLVLGHALTHQMELEAPHLYRRFRESVMPLVRLAAWKKYQDRLQPPNRKRPARVQEKDKFAAHAQKVGTFRHVLDRVAGPGKRGPTS